MSKNVQKGRDNLAEEQTLPHTRNCSRISKKSRETSLENKQSGAARFKLSNGKPESGGSRTRDRKRVERDNANEAGAERRGSRAQGR